MLEDINNAQLLDKVDIRCRCSTPGALLAPGIELYFANFNHKYVECWLDKEMTRKQIISPYAIKRITRPTTGEVIYEYDPRELSNNGVS